MAWQPVEHSYGQHIQVKSRTFTHDEKNNPLSTSRRVFQASSSKLTGLKEASLQEAVASLRGMLSTGGKKKRRRSTTGGRGKITKRRLSSSTTPGTGVGKGTATKKARLEAELSTDAGLPFCGGLSSPLNVMNPGHYDEGEAPKAEEPQTTRKVAGASSGAAASPTV